MDIKLGFLLVRSHEPATESSLDSAAPTKHALCFASAPPNNGFDIYSFETTDGKKNIMIHGGMLEYMYG
jgi:hypothetical protein